MNKRTHSKKTKKQISEQEELRRKQQMQKGFLSLYYHWLANGKPAI